MTKQAYLAILFVAILINCNAQVSTDSIVMAPVEINAFRIANYSSPVNHQEIDSTHLFTKGGSNLSDIGSLNNFAYIKSYGLGSAATSSVRGSTASQNLINWNGISINNPMLGQLDLNQIPLEFVDKLDLFKGGSASLWGSGAIGGSIDLQNTKEALNGYKLKIGSSVRSYEGHRNNLQFDFSNGKLYSSTRLLFDRAKNEFDFNIPGTTVVKKIDHNALNQRGFYQYLNLPVNEEQQLSFYFWHQQTDKLIPPTVVQNESKASQEDKFRRLMLSWSIAKSNLKVENKIAYLDESIYYEDSINLDFILSEFGGLHASSDWTFNNKKNLKYYLGISNRYTFGNIESYETRQVENRTALVLGLDKRIKYFKINLSLRQVLLDGKAKATLPSATLKYLQLEYLESYFKISRNYRLPTLNDRFWRPGGNTDLLPESGWSQELGFKISNDYQSKSSALTFAMFNRNISNSILWSRNENDNFFSASNITEVWSRGVELGLDWKKKMNAISVELHADYTYVKSTNEVNLSFPSIPEGQQLFYTPEHQLSSSLLVGLDGISLEITHQFFSSSIGINERIDANHLMNLRAQYQLSNASTEALFYININNTFDNAYYIIERRPMPGRNFRAGLIFTIKKNKN